MFSTPSIFKKYFLSYSGLSRLSWQIILLNFLESTFVGIYYFLPLYFVSKLNISITTASAIISFYGLGTILGGYLGGTFSDKLNPGKVATLGLLFQGLTLTFLIYIKNEYHIAIDLFFMGIASYGFITANQLLVLNTCNINENSKLKAINILNVASNLGSGLSAVIVSFLAVFSFEFILKMAAISIFFATAYSIYLNKLITRQNFSNNPKISTSTNESQVVQRYSHEVFYLILVCLFLIGLIIFQMNTTYAIFIKQTFPQLGIKGVGFLYFLNCFLVVLLQAPLVDKFRHHNKIMMTGVGAFLLGFGMFILNFSFSFSVAILSCFIYTIGEMIFFSMAQFICYHSRTQNQQGKNLGMYRVVYACSRIAGPVLAGYTFQNYGSHILWYLCGAIGLFSLLACSYFCQSRVKT